MYRFMMTLLWCSAVTSILILLYAALQPLLAKRYSERSRYYGWLVLVIGLLIPFRPALPQLPQPAPTSEPAVSAGTEGVLQNAAAAVNQIRPITYRLPAENPVAPVIPTARPLPVWELLAAVWAVGMLSFLLYHGIRHYRCSRLVRRWQEELTGGEPLVIMEALCTELGIRTKLRLYLCPCIASPMMVGFLKPKVLLPHNGYSGTELQLILRHELVHCKRRDLWYKGLVLIASAVHWFNPVIRYMGKAISAQCESSCDAQTVQYVGAEQRQQYIRLILATMRRQSGFNILLSTNFTGGKKKMKKRISAIIDVSKKKRGIAVIAALLVFTLGTGAAFAEEAKESVTPVEEKAAESGVDSEISLYQKYEEFGLTLNKKDNRLYFQDKLVRYFEDFYPIGGGISDGIDYFEIAGVIDVHAVRDLDDVTRNADGSFASGGRLTGVKAYSQEEFDKRDIKELKQSRIDAASAVALEEVNEVAEDIDVSKTTAEAAVRAEQEALMDAAEEAAENAAVAEAVAAEEAKPLSSAALAKLYAEYESFGVTYNEKQDALYYKGEMIRQFTDIKKSGEHSEEMMQRNNSSGTVDVSTVREFSKTDQNGNGKLTGMKTE